MKDIKDLLDDYTKWLRDKITFEQYGQYYEITAPFLDASNDYLQLYVKLEGNEVYFTDDGFVLNELEFNNVKLNSKRKQQIQLIASQFGVTVTKDELTMKAPQREFAQHKHMFIQAMLRIGDMYMTSQTRMPSVFMDDVVNFFKKEEIYCTENVAFAGRTGYNHVYDFLFQRSKTKKERLCNVINNPTKSNVNNSLFSWLDTKDTRKADSQFILLLNDQNKINSDVLDSAYNYDVKVIKWSERDKKENLELLAS